MRKLLILAALLFAAPLLAQSAMHATPMNSFASDFQTVPVMGNAPGVAGSHFQTYVAVMNPTASGFSIQVTLYDASGATHNATISLAAGETKIYQNFLDAVFNGFVGGGAVTLAAPGTAGGTHNNRFIVNVESYTSGATRYGTMVPVLEFAGSGSRMFTPGVSVDSTQRTNVGCYNQSGAQNAIVATVKDATGTQSLGTVTLNLAANAWGQTAVTTTVSNGTIQFDPAGAAVCYAVVVQNATNDAHFVAAAEYAP
jgi:hypothetical protein